MKASMRLVLLAAGGCAALGFALKIADLTGGAPSAAKPAGVAERAGSSRTASRPGELDVGHEGSRNDVASASHEADADAPETHGTSAPRPASHGRSQTAYELLESGRVHTLSPRQA